MAMEARASSQPKVSVEHRMKVALARFIRNTESEGWRWRRAERARGRSSLEDLGRLRGCRPPRRTPRENRRSDTPRYRAKPKGSRPAAQGADKREGRDE